MYQKTFFPNGNMDVAKHIPADDLYVCVRPFIKLGQIVGICPYRHVWHPHPEVFPSYRWKSIPAVVTGLLKALLAVNVIMNFGGMIRKIMNGQSNPIQIAWALMSPLFYSVGFYTYVHFALNGKKLCALFLNWRSTCRELVYFDEVNSTKWKIRFWCFGVLVSAVCENIVYHTRVDCSQSNCNKHQTPTPGKNFTAMDDIQEYYWREHGETWYRMPYTLPMTALLFLIQKFTVLATNFGDITIISMGWVLASKFQGFLQHVKCRVEDNSVSWLQVRKDFVALHKLLLQVNEFLSPLIFASYTLLLELISTQIHLGITTDAKRPLMAKVYSIWSFLHLVVRLLLISVTSSRITEVGQEMLFILQKCPAEKFTNEVERLERLVATPIGLTGLGCFRISKPFMLSVIHVIFTCEIIFLQTAPVKPVND